MIYITGTIRWKYWNDRVISMDTLPMLRKKNKDKGL